MPMASNSMGVSTIMVVSLKEEKPIRPRVMAMVMNTPTSGNSEPRQFLNSSHNTPRTMAIDIRNSHHLLIRSCSIQARK